MTPEPEPLPSSDSPDENGGDSAPSADDLIHDFPTEILVEVDPLTGQPWQAGATIGYQRPRPGARNRPPPRAGWAILAIILGAGADLMALGLGIITADPSTRLSLPLGLVTIPALAALLAIACGTIGRKNPPRRFLASTGRMCGWLSAIAAAIPSLVMDGDSLLFKLGSFVIINVICLGVIVVINGALDEFAA